MNLSFTNFLLFSDNPYDQRDSKIERTVISILKDLKFSINKFNQPTTINLEGIIFLSVIPTISVVISEYFK